MFLFTTEPKDSIGGPLWFIQLWAYAYFPQLAPKPNPSVLGRISCYAHLFALFAYEPDHIPTFEDWFNLFSDKERVRPASHFLPFAEAKFTCPEMFLLGQGVNPLSLSLWAHVLQTRDLVILQNKSSGVEWSVCTNEDAEVIIVEGLSKITDAKIEPFRMVSDALPLFTSWWEALMLSFNSPETLKLTVWEVCPHCLAFEILVFTRRSKGILIKESAVEKDLASALAKANQVIASQRQEITTLSIKAHQDVVSIITQEILVHLSSPEKKKKLAAEKERAIKIKQEQTLQVEAAMEAKKKAIHDEEEKRRIELERRQKEELDAKRKAEIEHKKQKEVEADPLTVPIVPTVEETKEETTTPVISTPELEITEPTLEDVDQSTALVLATLTLDAKPLSQQPLLDTQIIKVDIEDLSEPEVDQLIKKASSVLEEMKSASKTSTLASSKTSSSPVSQGMNAVVVMRSILEQPLDNLCFVFPPEYILASFSPSFKLFFVGVSRFAEGSLGPPPLEGYVSSDSVLHRLAAELYSIVYPALSTWEAVRSRMAANETEWSLPLSEELPEGLSDESAGRVAGDPSSDAVPSTSGSRQQPRVDRVVQGLPSSDRIWKDGYFFVCGDNWERLPQEDPRDFVGVRRSWGTPSRSALNRPLLNSVWQERIWKILDIEDRRYNIFIEPDLLATFSLGPVPSSSVRALVKANKKRVNTMKLNKNRLKQLAQSGEVAIAPVSLKRKKPDEGSSKRAEEAPPRPSVPVVTPVLPTAVPSGQEGPGLTEAMVMARRCASVEEDLAMLRAKSIADEAEMKNAKKAVMELTRDRKEALNDAEKLKKELKARDDDVKAAVDAKDKAVADLKHLVGQIEGAKEAAVSEFRASEAFEDINTRYFLVWLRSLQKASRPALPRFRFLRSSTL
uniref:Aminotransferase-like plant mobile domain-containing protein n=1 Tax=Fagus sylvatica TaxID=28930 RepID=A0A2N9HHF3_FAGSY